MDVLSGRILLRPTDLERSLVFYRDVLGLAIAREFGTGIHRGTVFFLGGGFLEVSGTASAVGPGSEDLRLWLQVRDLVATHRELLGKGATVLREPRREAWGLDEMWIADPDGVRICVVQVPDEHPMRFRPGI
ncbi:VOC family protein [Embleya sp. NBC_00888]|uniref:VOC family protein n=1 Tax=Embleya sp. NBC_00888 TaxID=2975960 RepID=UPI003867E27B|nr:VOC family protein [Embleya sp. NBC_00888]